MKIATLFGLCAFSICCSAADNWSELTTVKGTVSHATAEDLVIMSKDADRGFMEYPLTKVARHVQLEGKILNDLVKKRDVPTLEKYAKIQPSQLPPGARVEVLWKDSYLSKEGKLVQVRPYFQVRLMKLLDEDRKD